MQVDFLASKQLTAEELATQRERLQALTKATRVIEIDLDGERVSVRPSVVSRLHTEENLSIRNSTPKRNKLRFNYGIMESQLMLRPLMLRPSSTFY